MVAVLTTDLDELEGVPYFLWDEDVTVRELREILAGPDTHRKLQLFGRMLREARDTDVWKFTTPSEVDRLLPVVARRVGRRLPFWRFLIDGWKADGLLS
jgi:hypothetical protein